MIWYRPVSLLVETTIFLKSSGDRINWFNLLNKMLKSERSRHHARSRRQPSTTRQKLICALYFLFLHFGTIPTNSFSLPKTSHVSKGRIVAMRPFSSSRKDPLQTPTSTSTTTISKLSSFQDGDPTTVLGSFTRTTAQPLLFLVAFSLALALGMIAWEDYGATNLWPSRRMVVCTTTISSTPTTSADSSSSGYFGSRTIRGLGFGKIQRLQTLQDLSAQEKTSLVPDIRSYNEVLEEHRANRLSRWQDSSADNPKQLTSESIKTSVQDLRDILWQVLELQTLVKDYQWDAVHASINDSILPKLEPAATVLRLHLSSARDESIGYSNLGYEEIGFDWGSCAWRHCGALADAQEALDELDHLLGVLEPPECLFCLDVVERSIRDMLTVVPAQYHALEGMPVYQKFESAHVSNDDFGGETDVLDQEYLRMLEELRSPAGGED